MRRYTERVRFTLPAETKVRLKVEALAREISLSELVRRKLHDQTAWDSPIETVAASPLRHG